VAGLTCWWPGWRTCGRFDLLVAELTYMWPVWL